MTRLATALEQGIEKLALALAVLAALAMTAIVGLIVASVILRKFASPLHITEEMVGLLLSVSLLLALPMVTLKAGHVRVSIVETLLAGPARMLLAKAALLVGTLFFAWLTIEAVPWWEFAYRLNLKTETARILLYPWMALLPISVGLTGLIFFLRLVGLIANADAAPDLEG